MQYSQIYRSLYHCECPDATQCPRSAADKHGRTSVAGRMWRDRRCVEGSFRFYFLSNRNAQQALQTILSVIMYFAVPFHSRTCPYECSSEIRAGTHVTVDMACDQRCVISLPAIRLWHAHSACMIPIVILQGRLRTIFPEITTSQRAPQVQCQCCCSTCPTQPPAGDNGRQIRIHYHDDRTVCCAIVTAVIMD